MLVKAQEVSRKREKKAKLVPTNRCDEFSKT